MSDLARTSRPITLRARRDTIALIIGALGLTGALASAIHAQRSAPNPSVAVWTGNLSEVAPEAVPDTKPAITSASLVVPASVLALPRMPPSTHPRAKACEGSSCQAKALGVPAPAPRRIAELETSPSSDVVLSEAAVESVPRPPADVGATRPGLIARMNPLRHLPDMAVVRRPLTAANETIYGWFKRF